MAFGHDAAGDSRGAGERVGVFGGPGCAARLYRGIDGRFSCAGRVVMTLADLRAWILIVDTH